MNTSLNWLKDYLTIDLSPEKVGEVLTEIGLEVEGLEKIESIKGGLEGVVVGYVLECEQHPNADRLKLTKVDIGADEPLQIVCGAPNVAKGQKVPVATVGTTLYPTEGDALTIKKGKIRGEVSMGMICAEDELGLGASHAGIIVLPEEVPVGTPASEVFDVEVDYVYEIGLTPNRSDATNHIGVAKDLGAALKMNYEHSGEVRIPEVADFRVDHHNLPIEVEVRNAEACPRYAGLTISNITIKESPEWLKNRLKSIGVKTINNIVDITNFILHELGQPLHAFDYEAITNRKIIVDTLPKGTMFKTLDWKESGENNAKGRLELLDTDLMICDGKMNGMCMGGVYGGVNSGVKEQTTSIFLESAHFNPKFIRRSSMQHNLRTDAAKVYEKGSDPSICLYALKRAALLIKELAGGEIASEVIDLYPKKIMPVEVKVNFKDVNTLIGVDIPKEKVLEILAALEMELVEQTRASFTVKVPTNKSDVLRPVDVIEEILRIYGLNMVPMGKQIKMSLTYGTHPTKQNIRNLLSDYLVANGFVETMNLSLSQSRYHEEILPIPTEAIAFIHNTSNVHLDIMRPTMLFSALETIVHNQNRQQTDLKLFEVGKTYKRSGESYQETEHFTIFMTGQRWNETWLFDSNAEVSYFTLKTFVTNLLERLGLRNFQATPVQDDVFAFAMQFHRGKQDLVTFGKVQAGIAKAMEVRNNVFYADFNMDNVFAALKKSKVTIEEPGKYPSSRRDLALVVGQAVKFEDIATIAQKVGKKLLTSINLFDVYENEEQLGASKKSYAVSLLFEDKEKTLKVEEVDKIMDKMIQNCEKQLGAVVRR